MLPTAAGNGFLVQQAPINFLTEDDLNRLTLAFQNRYDREESEPMRKRYGRHWLVYLLLRFTGARVSEVLNLTYDDIDFRNAEVKLVTLKRHNPKRKNSYRIVPIPANVTSEIATYIAQYPEMKEVLFMLNRTVFYKVFKEMCQRAGIPSHLAHPHILRHTRAIELLRAGVPVTVVQDLLGHSALTTTAIYLKISGQEAKNILKEKGLL